MACNCTTNEQLAELYKRFGQKSKVPKSASMKFKIKAKVEDAAEYVVLSIMMPLFMVFLVYTFFFKDRKISFREFFDLKEENSNIYQYYVKQQELQNKNKD